MDLQQQLNLLFIVVVVALALGIYAVARHESDDVNDGEITSAKLAADAVTSAKIADDAVLPEHLDATKTYEVATLTTGAVSKSSGVSINASGGAINIGDEANAYNVNVGTGAAARNVVLGNTTGATQVALRRGTGGLLQASPTPAASIGTGAQTITIAQLLTEVLEEDPEGAATWTMPTAALAVAGIDGVAAGDHIDFFIVNNATSAADEPITVAVGTGGTLVGRAAVEAASVSGEENSGGSHWRMRFTAVASGSEAYSLYRLA